MTWLHGSEMLVKLEKFRVLIVKRNKLIEDKYLKVRFIKLSQFSRNRNREKLKLQKAYLNSLQKRK